MEIQKCKHKSKGIEKNDVEEKKNKKKKKKFYKSCCFNFQQLQE